MIVNCNIVVEKLYGKKRNEELNCLQIGNPQVLKCLSPKVNILGKFNENSMTSAAASTDFIQ